MKTMTCKQLGGTCDKEFHTGTFEEIAGMSKKHGMEMFLPGEVKIYSAFNFLVKL